MSGQLAFLAPDDLLAAGRELPAQFVMRLKATALSPPLNGAAGSEIEVECREILRLLPGRRLVARVQVNGTDAVMKLFLGPGARRYRRREVRGCARLAAADVATPALLGELEAAAGDTPALALLFEYLDLAGPVPADADGAVAAAAEQLGRLHRAGCRYRDLHLDNFLERSDGAVFVIDGDGVRPGGARTRLGAAFVRSGTPRPGLSGIGRRRGLEDLAVLCAQRRPLADPRLAPVYDGYLAGRGWPAADPAALAGLAQAVRRQRGTRVRRYLEKAQRDCTEFHQHRGRGRWVVAVRAVWDDALADFARDPEAWFRGATLLKDGNSATVVRARFGDRTRIIKRYNLKNPWHAVRRALKPVARFRRAWLNGQRLHFLGIATGRPLALVERRWGFWPGVAYLVMEDLGDTDLAADIQRSGLSEARLTQVVGLFRALAAAGLVHGDTKASNFLVTKSGIALVDLDAMHEGATQRRDVERFLANFEDLPDVRGRLQAALAVAG